MSARSRASTVWKVLLTNLSFPARPSTTEVRGPGSPQVFLQLSQEGAGPRLQVLCHHLGSPSPGCPGARWTQTKNLLTNKSLTLKSRQQALTAALYLKPRPRAPGKDKKKGQETYF